MATGRIDRWRHVAGRALVLCSIGCAAGCTAGDYEVGECDPDVPSQGDDVCERMNEGATCTPWQCDAASRRCVERPRDDDRDGDPSAECGGSDCDDADARVSSLSAEECDQADNDCDGVVDEGVLTFGSPGSAVEADADWTDPRIVVPFNGPSEDRRLTAVVRDVAGAGSRCVRVFSSDQPPGSSLCTMLDDEQPHQPRHPSADAQGGAVLAAWSETEGCSAGRVMLARASNFEGGGASEPLELASCVAGVSGGSFPSVALSRDPQAGTALVVWRAEPVSAAVAPESPACSDAPAVPLGAALVDVGSLGVIADATLGASLALRAPAVLGIPAAEPTFLVAAALENGGVGLALVGSSLPGVDAWTAIGALPALRSAVTLGVGEYDQGRIRVGVGIESGCAPSQAWFAEATIDLALGTVLVTDAVRLDAGPRAASVAAAWSPARGEWLVGWVGAGLGGRRVRVEDGVGVPVDPEPIAQGGGAVAPLTLGVLRSLADDADWNVTFFDNGDKRGLAQTVLGCSNAQ